VTTAHRQLEGGGFPVRRPFPTTGLDQVDPFLLLDEMGPVDWRPGQAIGAPDHPHRGFETVTYVLAGEMEHADSAGHRGRLGPGDVQWMTAGSGVVHSEMPSPDLLAAGGRMHGFQVWVNLPAADKMIKPRYQEVSGEAIPVGSGRVAFLGQGDRVEFSVPDDATERADLLLLAGVPLDEPVVRWGPFVMNSTQQIQTALDDFHAGRMGTIAH